MLRIFIFTNKVSIMELDATKEEIQKLYEYILTLEGGTDIDVDITKEEIKILMCKALRDYTSEINQWYIKNNFGNIQGFPSSINFTSKFVTENGMLAQRISDWFSSMQRVGGKIPWKRDFIVLESGRQVYNMATESSIPYTPGTRRIHRVMWQGAPEIFGADFNTNYANSTLFQFGQQGLAYGNNPMAYLGNAFDAVLLAQSYEIRNTILRSEFFHNLSGDILELTPRPGGQGLQIEPGSMVFYYYFDEVDFLGLDEQTKEDAVSLISNPAEVKLDVILYSKLTSASKNWIDNWTSALAKYMFGSKLRMIRTIASPDSEYQVELGPVGDALIEESKSMKTDLLQQLKDWLLEMDADKLMTKKAEMWEAAKKINNGPRKFFLG